MTFFGRISCENGSYSRNTVSGRHCELTTASPRNLMTSLMTMMMTRCLHLPPHQSPGELEHHRSLPFPRKAVAPWAICPSHPWCRVWAKDRKRRSFRDRRGRVGRVAFWNEDGRVPNGIPLDPENGALFGGSVPKPAVESQTGLSEAPCFRVIRGVLPSKRSRSKDWILCLRVLHLSHQREPVQLLGEDRMPSLQRILG